MSFITKIFQIINLFTYKILNIFKALDTINGHSFKNEARKRLKGPTSLKLGQFLRGLSECI